MTHESRTKVNGWAKVGAIVALISLSMFFLGKASEAGEAKQQIADHTRRLDEQAAQIRELQRMGVDVAVTRRMVEEIQKQLDKSRPSEITRNF